MFVEMEETQVQGYGVFDGCYGIVENCCRKGAFLALDNCELAFAMLPRCISCSFVTVVSVSITYYLRNIPLRV